MADLDEIKSVFNLAMHEEVLPEHVENMTLYSKCSLIHDIVDALKAKVPQSRYGTASHTRKSLTTIVSTFSPTDGFLQYQDQKRRFLLAKISNSDKGQEILSSLSSWNSSKDFFELSDALLKSSRLHLDTYLVGMFDVLPTKYSITRGAGASSRMNVVNLGGFAGDLKNGKGKIRVNVDDYYDECVATDILNTLHHETTHAIQLCFAHAYHKQKVPPNHPLYDDAKMFHAIEVKNAVIPVHVLKSSEQDAYKLQVHEMLADAEGQKISTAIMDLV